MCAHDQMDQCQSQGHKARVNRKVTVFFWSQSDGSRPKQVTVGSCFVFLFTVVTTAASTVVATYAATTESTSDEGMKFVATEPAIATVIATYRVDIMIM